MEEMMEINDEEKMEEHVTCMKKKREEHVTCMKKRAQYWRRSRPTIYKVPLTLRQCDKAAYEPRFVSIGPYHRGLRAEDIKYQYLNDFLSRNPCRSLEDYFKEVEKLEEQARGCYSEEILQDRLGFTEVMVLDGCFVIELFLKKWDGRARQARAAQAYDPVYSHTWLDDMVHYDLLLLENQLPFFILESLYGILEVSDTPLVKIAFINFSWLIDTTEVNLESESIHHLLHLVHSHLFPRQIPSLSLSPPPTSLSPPPPPTSSTRSTRRLIRNIWVCCKKLVHYLMQKLKNLLRFFQKYMIYFTFRMISCFCSCRFRAKEAELPTHHIRSWPKFYTETCPSATRLYNLGVTFREQKVPKSPLDITFNFSSGTMEIPYLCVDDGTNTLFRNLAAFEQCVPSAGVEFISYVSFMDNIVNTAQDVEILRRCGIIENLLGSDEEVALLFNRMCTGIIIGREDTQISQVIKNAKVYSEIKRNVLREISRRDCEKYLGGPWSLISVIAAAFVILLTLIQTIFAFLSYFQGST